jgi:hypothetical protein
MKRQTYTLPLLIFLLSACIPAFTQNETLFAYLAEVSTRYGSDADLVNGEKYYYPYGRAEGSPFLYPDQTIGLLRIKGRDFPNQMVKYDIYNQQLVLEYTDSYGSQNNLVLRIEWVDHVDFGRALFKKMKGPEGGDTYLQRIYEGSLSCYYQWTKEYQLSLNSGTQNYYFTDPIRTSYLVRDGVFTEYRNNRTFLKAFEKARRKEIKQHLSENKLKVNRASDLQMAALIEYCETLENEAN